MAKMSLGVMPATALIVACLLASILLVRNRLERLHATHSQEPVWLLQRSPNTFKGLDLWCLSFSILAKYVPGTKGFRNSLRPSPTYQHFALPLIHIEGVLQFDSGDTRRFLDALRLDGSPTDSPNELFLIALTAPLLIYILAQHDNPVKPLGAVNTRNAFQFVDVAACRDVDALRSAARDGRLTFSAIFGGAQRPGIRRKRGMEFEITISVFLHDKPILVQHLFFLQFLPRSTRPEFNPAPAKQDAVIQQSLTNDTAETELPPLTHRSPRLWAASCGDYNPIHISPLAARLFGFPSIIAHGNHVTALALNALHGAVDGERQRSSYTLDVKYVRPLALPARPTLQWSKTSSGDVCFNVCHGDTTCIIGSINEGDT